MSETAGLVDGRPLRYRSTASTGGPWSPDTQHGGPPNALAVAVAEQLVARTTGRADLTAVRLAADFLGPVPVGELSVTPRVARAGRSAALVTVAIAPAADPAGANRPRECLQCRIWFVRNADTAAVAPVPHPEPVPASAARADIAFPYARTLEWRFETGGMSRPGPATAWVRPTVDLLPGHTMSSLSQVVLIADSASGISAELSWDEWSFANVDLDVHIARPMSGPWLRMAARTVLGPAGWAVARSELSDEAGPLGGGLQSLVLAPLTRRE